MNDIPGDGEANNTGFADIPDVPLGAISSRVIPRQVQSGVERGTRTVMNTDGSYVTIGQIPDNSGTFGIAVFNPAGVLLQKIVNNTTYMYDESGNIVQKIVDGTTYYYDPTDNGINVAVAGKLSNGKYGMRTTAGVDVTTATQQQLTFDSLRNTFNVVQTNTVTIPGTGNQAAFATGSTGLTVPHNLGYVPSFLCYAFMPIVPSGGQPPVTSWNQLIPAGSADSSQMTYNVQAGTDSTNLYLVDFWSNNGNITPVQAINVTYYLFTNTINN